MIWYSDKSVVILHRNKPKTCFGTTANSTLPHVTSAVSSRNHTAQCNTMGPPPLRAPSQQLTTQTVCRHRNSTATTAKQRSRTVQHCCQQCTLSQSILVSSFCIKTAQSLQWLSSELGDPRFEFRKGRRFFYSPKRPDQLQGPPGLKWPGTWTVPFSAIKCRR